MNCKTLILTALAIGSTFAVDAECWMQAIGYPCCKNKDTRVMFTNSDGLFPISMENGTVCGVSDKQICPSGGVDYKCCTSTCKVVYTDTSDWGVENDEWCSIPYSCSESNKPKVTTTTTSTRTTTTYNKASPTACAKSYYPCGGTDHPDAPKCCEPGLICVVKNEKNYRCYPENDLSEPLTTTTTTTTTTYYPQQTYFPPPPVFGPVFGGCYKAFDYCLSPENCCVAGFKCDISPEVGNRYQCIRDYDQPPPTSTIPGAYPNGYVFQTVSPKPRATTKKN